MSEQDREQSDPGFRIVDKRQSASEGEEPAGEPGDAESAAEDAAAASAASDMPHAVPGEEAPVEAVTVLGIVEYCVTLLNAHAWQCMGLVMNPLTRKVEKDLEQARVAIDCVEALFSQVESRLPDAEVKRFRQLLTDLRVNFVQQSQKPPS